MIQLSWWEEAVVGMVISFLTILMSKIKNQTEIAGLQLALVFLQRLLAGQVAQA